MEANVKSRQGGAIPKSIGRQIGVLPVSGGAKLRRGHGDGNISVPVGGTDIKQELIPSYQNRPPSGSSSRSLSETKSTHADRATLESGRPSRNASSTLKKLPGSSSSLHSDYSVEILDTHSAKSGRNRPLKATNRSDVPKASPHSSREADKARKLSSNSGTQKSSARGKEKRPGSGRRGNKDEDLNLPTEISDEQDIKFYDIPSQRSRSGSKTKRSVGSADSRQHENGRKPYKTIDPEEIVAQNMESDLNKIYEISLHASEITHIDNLEKFKKLKVLDLSCNFIELIQNLEFSKDLRELKLYDNRIRRLEGLDNLRELLSLQLQHNRIKNIGKGLTGLKKLKTLRIDCNQLLKIETPELSQCVQLTSLDISYNMLDSLAALNYLPNLEEVNASGNRMRSVSDLSKCKLLQEVDLSGNRLTDLSGLRGLPKLMTLNISNNQLTSLKSVGRLKSLQDLLAGSNQIHELSTVPTQLPMLEVLDLTNNEITDWDEFYHLDQMTELVELFISGNPFCAQDGSMPHYFSAIQSVLPDLEIIDGAHIKKHVSKGAPLMRPMSASTIVSLRQMDTQMRSADEQMKTLERSLEEKFASLRATCDSLPLEPPRSSRVSSSSATDDTPVSSRSSSSRNRILQAKKYADSVNRK